jgi:FAD/FMN-containing dehydrogenase
MNAIKHPSAKSTNSVLVNDCHSALNSTYVASVATPKNVQELADLVKNAHGNNQQIAVAGGRHAMGGQQFLNNGLLVDMTSMNKILNFDAKNGLIEVEAGLMWPELILFLQSAQTYNPKPWTIAQKQTGCDRLSMGGAIAANVHGRGLNKAPLVEDVEEFSIVVHDGTIRRCSRNENQELFSLAIGGYGLFGIISHVTLRLTPHAILRRTVEVCTTEQAVRKLEERKRAGATYGDFQFAIDHKSPDFLLSGILSTYAPTQGCAQSANKLLKLDQWEELLFLAHSNKSAAFEKYKNHYLSTNGQLYSSDTFQLATYVDGYHKRLDERLNSPCSGSEAISELYVPRSRLGQFMKEAACVLRRDRADVIYGTVRLIEEDVDTFMPWATQPWACIVFNLHVDHNNESIAATSQTFRNLYDFAIKFGGKYYLTYNRFASARQLRSCYNQIDEFLKLKLEYDPDVRFKSDWYTDISSES